MSLLNVEATVRGLDSERKHLALESKEEAFFDSQGWLDSDCEDDFVSVNGDLTPSRLSSPNFQMNKQFTVLNSTIESFSPDAAKRKLSELLRDNEVVPNQKQVPEFLEVDANTLPQLNHQTFKLSGITSCCCNAGKPSEEFKEEKKMKANTCCLPSLACSFRLKERRKQKMSSVG
ncbi:uncharacterized protein At3g27210-like [Zingiber officinale]|nr:uncharacterized protein At3g27210-like [Zingiber officinale]